MVTTCPFSESVFDNWCTAVRNAYWQFEYLNAMVGYVHTYWAIYITKQPPLKLYFHISHGMSSQLFVLKRVAGQH